MRYRWILLVCCAALLSACAQATSTPSPLPPIPAVSATANAEIAASPTPILRATLPPAWTESAATHLPSASPTLTLTPSATLDLTNPAIMSRPTLEVCGSFGEDLERNATNFPIGSSPQVYWTRVEGAELYAVTLFNAEFVTLFSGFTPETSFVFDGELFELGGIYTWEVRPLNGLGVQLCISRGALLIPVIG
jgi:hypothetical protein